MVDQRTYCLIEENAHIYCAFRTVHSRTEATRRGTPLAGVDDATV